jgi:hypothetical protein
LSINFASSFTFIVALAKDAVRLAAYGSMTHMQGETSQPTQRSSMGGFPRIAAL